MKFSHKAKHEASSTNLDLRRKKDAQPSMDVEEMKDLRGVMAMEVVEFREDGEGEERKLRENEMK